MKKCSQCGTEYPNKLYFPKGSDVCGNCSSKENEDVDRKEPIEIKKPFFRFKENEFWEAYAPAVFVINLFLVPFILSKAFQTKDDVPIFFSVLLIFMFLVAHRRSEGLILRSLIRIYFFSIAVGILASLVVLGKIVLQGRNGFVLQSLLFAPILYLVMFISGWLGICFSRLILRNRVVRNIVEGNPKKNIEEFVSQSYDEIASIPEILKCLQIKEASQGFGDDKYLQILVRTKRAWENKQLDHLSEDFSTFANSTDINGFANHFSVGKSLIYEVFQLVKIDDDEFLIATGGKGSDLNQVLTNKYFYFWGTYSLFFDSSSRRGILSVQDVKTCKRKNKILSRQFIITLKSGNKLFLDEVPFKSNDTKGHIYLLDPIDLVCRNKLDR